MPGIVLGIALKENLKAKLGDCVQVTSPTIGYSFIRGALRPPVAKEFRVTGVFQAGFDQYDSKLVYTDLFEAQAFYEGGWDVVTRILKNGHGLVIDVLSMLDRKTKPAGVSLWRL